jgi:hypothetical protein
MSGMEAGMWCHCIDIHGLYNRRALNGILARIFPSVLLVRVVEGLDLKDGDYDDGAHDEEDVLCALRVVFKKKDLQVCFEKDC